MGSNKIKEEFVTAIRAGYSHFFIQTSEMNRALESLSGAVNEYTKSDGVKPYKAFVLGLSDNPDPRKLIGMIDAAEPGSVFFLKNFNWFLDPRSPVGKFSCDAIQLLQDRLSHYRSKPKRKIIAIISSTSVADGLPRELQSEFMPLRFERPSEDDIQGIVKYIVRSVKENNPKIQVPLEAELAKVVNAARGMCSQEIENALSFCFVKEGQLNPLTVSSIKAKMLEKVSGVSYGTFTETFESIIGHDHLKAFFNATVHHPLAKGIMLVGPPGCGKTLFGKAAGNAAGLPVLIVEFANVFGSLLGETYEKMQALIDIIKAMGRCIVFVDEIEKGMAGVAGDGGTTGNEVTKRAMSMWLKFMSEPRECYIIATCNDISAFRGAEEYLRAQRWDCAPFFIDLPNIEEKKAILKHYQEQYSVKGNPGPMHDWSGAEIESCCRIASMMGVSLKDAQEYIIPIGRIMGKERLEAFRKWAETNTVLATKPIRVNVSSSSNRSIDLD